MIPNTYKVEAKVWKAWSEGARYIFNQMMKNSQQALVIAPLNKQGMKEVTTHYALSAAEIVDKAIKEYGADK